MVLAPGLASGRPISVHSPSAMFDCFLVSDSLHLYVCMASRPSSVTHLSCGETMEHGDDDRVGMVPGHTLYTFLGSIR
jgi:hypothetical protein